MTKLLSKYARTSAMGAFAAAPMYPGAPRIMFAPEDGTGTGEGEGDGTGEGADDKSGESAGDGSGDGDDTSADDKSGKSDDGKSKTDDKAKNKTDDEKASLLREVMEKKSAIKTLNEQLKKFEGIDPDAVRALLKEKADAELAAEEAKGNFDRVKQMMAEAHDSEKKSLQDKIDELTGKLSERDVELDRLTVGQSFATSAFIADELTIPASKAQKIYGEFVERVNGEVVVYDKPVSASDRTVLTGADGKPLSFDASIRKLVELDPDRDRLIKQKVAPGAASSSKKVDGEGAGAAPDKKLFGAARILAGLNSSK